ncbi:hypothetical protein H0H93_000920 [Arthromyces matolae]|nr:hypothetical protein H0H93_000920 [Arthromyces matolae]
MSDSTASAQAPIVSQKFQAPDAEIVFKSADGVLFRIHKLNLTACSEGFTPPENSTFDEIVPLTEDSATLERLFQFIYPQPQPELDDLDFGDLAQLAEAAEKYRVFPTMNLCTIRLQDHLDNHSEEILLHALKHGVRNLTTSAALLLLNQPLDEFVQTLPLKFMLPWPMETSFRPRNFTCDDVASYSLVLLSNDLHALQDPSAVVSIPTCCPSVTKDLLRSWITSVNSEIASIPSFADIAFPGDEEDLKEPQESKITFISKDNVSFSVSVANIKASSRNLLPTQHNQPVHLPETSHTLDLLFKFLVAAPHPNLDDVAFDILGPLSIAADHYEIFPAMQMIMMGQLPKYLIPIMEYALKSENYELMDKAAPLLAGKPLVDVLWMIDIRDAIKAWLKYMEEWNKVLVLAVEFSDQRKVVRNHITGKYKLPISSCWGCQGCMQPDTNWTTIAVLRKLRVGVKALLDLDDTFVVLAGSVCCTTTREDIVLWRTTVENAIRIHKIVATRIIEEFLLLRCTGKLAGKFGNRTSDVQALDAEITFKSSDGILFHIHKANLVACSESFTPPENSTFDEIVHLTEESATLELLFQFIYPQPNPDLDELKFEELALLAEAAEKYRVFPAMNLCAICMEHPDHLKAHAEEILQHALKHNIQTLASRAAPLLLNRPLDDFVQVLPHHFVISWSLEQVSDLAIKHAATLNGTSGKPCRTCGQLPHENVLSAASSICQNLVALQDLSAAVSIPPCCPDGTTTMVEKLKTLSASIPDFADFALPDEDLHEPLAQGEIFCYNVLVPDDDKVIGAASNDESKITYVSRDLVSFSVALENIKAWSTNLPNVSRLTETSSTLEFLFEFLRDAPHPDLDGFDFDFLGPLSLAAESYKVFPAMSVCRIQRERALGRGDLDKYPMAVMHYALESRNYELMDKAALLLLLESPVKIVQMIDNTTASASWFKFIEEWNRAHRAALAFSEKRRISTATHYSYSKSRRFCQGCDEPNPDLLTVMVLTKLAHGIKSLLDLDNTFDISVTFCCSTSRGDIEMWRDTVKNAIQSIPSFSSIFQQSLAATVE